MSSQATTSGSGQKVGRRVRGSLAIVMGVAAVAVVFIPGGLALLVVGLLLILNGVLELLETFQVTDRSELTSAYLSGEVSILAGILLLAQPQTVVRVLSLVIAGIFAVDGIGKLVAAWRARANDPSWKWSMIGGVINMLLAAILVFRWPISGLGVVTSLTGIRMIATGWSILHGRSDRLLRFRVKSHEGEHPDRGLGLPPHPEFDRLEQSLQAEEEQRWAIDLYWCFSLVLIFFAIHIGRMRVEWNLVGFVSPFVAVMGDIATALLIAFGIIMPLRLGWRRLVRPLERQAWLRTLPHLDSNEEIGLVGKLRYWWLKRRARAARRLSQAATTPVAALRWGVQAGLPITAILIAINPIWGFSWFFNSESWATEVWNRWAEARTDTWRTQMMAAVRDAYKKSDVPSDRLFQVQPDIPPGTADFSFLVMGDTGEGDASQFCLKDRFLAIGEKPEVKFLVISSDVIYPTGAMSDYEGKFYLPFKGYTKPIYAIPGNHDWYDALEGFAANFFEADSAHACMRARIMADNRLTSTTESHIDQLVREAARLRKEFNISAGHQRGPFFEVSTEKLSLIGVDTGVLKTMDTDQWKWFESALERAKGKFKFVILGHPLYAGGRYQGAEDAILSGEWAEKHLPSNINVLGQRTEVRPFVAIHQLLRKHEVDVAMAGDTHYFEHYQEKYQVGNTPRQMHHFVNGGGGAYISIGTPLDWPHQPAVENCAYFPRKDFLIAKLNAEMPIWKSPLWFWTKRMGAWPFSTELMSGAFDYNRAPYLQSFVEVSVEGSKNQVRLILHSATGRVSWQDLQCFGKIKPAGKAGDDFVEFVIPINQQP